MLKDETPQQFGGLINIHFDSSKVFSGRTLTIKANHIFAQYDPLFGAGNLSDLDTTLTITINSDSLDTTLTIDSLRFTPDTVLKAPSSLQLTFDGNSNTFWTDRTIRTARLNINSDYIGNFLDGDTLLSLAPFIIKQDTIVPAIVDGYSLVLVVDPSPIDINSQIVANPSLAIVMTTDSIIINLMEMLNDSINISGVVLSEVNNNTNLFWYFVPDTLVGTNLTNEIIPQVYSDTLYSLHPIFSLGTANIDNYGLNTNYRPVYFPGDPIPRPLLPIHIDDDPTGPGFVNRSLNLNLPDSAKWDIRNLKITGIDSNQYTKFLYSDSSVLILNIQEYDSVVNITLENLLIDVSNVGINDTTEPIKLAISNNTTTWDLGSHPITYSSSPKVSFNDTTKTTQVFWIDTSKDSVDWKISPLLIVPSDTDFGLPLFSERDVYFKFGNSHWFINNSVNLHDNNYDSLLADTVRVTIRDTSNSGTLRMCLTGNPDSLDAYWMPIDTLLFKSVNPHLKIRNRRFLDGDATDTLHLSISGIDDETLAESNAIFSLPDSFPAQFSNNSSVDILVNTSDLNLSLTPIDTTMNWGNCTLQSGDLDLLLGDDSLHAIRTDSVKVGGIYVDRIGAVRHCYNDPLDTLESIVIHLANAPLDSGDTLLILKNTNNNSASFSFLPNSNSRYSVITQSSDSIKIKINNGLNEDSLVIIGLQYGGFNNRGNTNFTLTAILKGETKKLHKTDTLSTIIVGKPNVMVHDIDVYGNQFDNALFSLIEDSKYVSLEPTRVLSFSILDSTKAYWKKSDYAYTSGYSDNGWAKVSHQPQYGDHDADSFSFVKSYSIIATFDTSDTVRAHVFDDFVLAGQGTDSIQIGLSTNNETNYDTISLILQPTAQAGFYNSNLVFIKTESTVHIDSLFLSPLDSPDSIEVISPENLDLIWLEDSIATTRGIDSLKVQNGDNKILSVFPDSGAKSISIQNYVMGVLAGARSYSAPLRIIIYTNGTMINNIITGQQITLGAPSLDIQKNLYLFKHNDEAKSFTLPRIDLIQDPYLLANSNERFIHREDSIYIRIPDNLHDILYFAINQGSAIFYYNSDSISTTLKRIRQDEIRFQVDTTFDAIHIDNISVQSDSSFLSNSFVSENLEFGLVDLGDKTGQKLGTTENSIQLVDINLILQNPRHLSVDSTFNYVHLDSIELTQNEGSTLLGNDRHVKITTNHPELFSFDANKSFISDDIHSFDVSDDSIELTITPRKNGYHFSLLPKVNIDSLLSRSEPVITININVTIDDTTITMSDSTITITTDQVFNLHKPIFYNKPQFSGDTLTISIAKDFLPDSLESLKIEMLPANSAAEFYERLGTSGSQWPLPSLTFADFNNSNQISKKIIMTKPEKILTTSNRQQSLIIKHSIRLKKQNKLFDKVKIVSHPNRTTDNTSKIQLVMDTSFVLSYYQELIHLLKSSELNKPKNFFVGFQGGLASNDTLVTNHYESLDWSAIKVDLGGYFNPLTDLNPNIQLFFKDSTYHLFKSGFSGNINITPSDTTIPDSSLFQYISGKREGLYLLSYKPNGGMPMYLQCIYDTTRPKLFLFSPYQATYRNTPLTVSYDYDTLRFREFDNFVLTDSTLIEYDMDTTYSSRLWTPIKYVPTLNLWSMTSLVDESLNDTTLLAKTVYDSALNYQFEQNAAYPFSELISNPIIGVVSLQLKLVDAAGNLFTNPYLLDYNIINRDGKEGLISDEIFNYPNPFKAG